MGAWPPVRKEDLDRRSHQFVCHSAERPLSVNPAGRQAHTHSEGTPDSGHSLNDQPDSTHSPTAPTQAREDEHLGPPTDVRRQRLPCTDHRHSMGDPTPQQTPLNASHSAQGHRSSWSTSHHSHRGARLRLLRRPPRRRPVLIAPPRPPMLGLSSRSVERRAICQHLDHLLWVIWAAGRPDRQPAWPLRTNTSHVIKENPFASVSEESLRSARRGRRHRHVHPDRHRQPPPFWLD